MFFFSIYYDSGQNFVLKIFSRKKRERDFFYVKNIHFSVFQKKGNETCAPAAPIFSLIPSLPFQCLPQIDMASTGLQVGQVQCQGYRPTFSLFLLSVTPIALQTELSLHIGVHVINRQRLDSRGGGSVRVYVAMLPSPLPCRMLIVIRKSPCHVTYFLIDANQE